MAGPWEDYQKAPATQNGPWADYAPAKPSVATDVAKAIPSGLAKGVIGLAGLPGAIEDGTNWLTRQTVGRVGNAIRGEGFTAPTFADIEQRRAAAGLGSQKALPSADTIRQLVEQNITGPLYEPQTVPGQYAGTVAEFLPSMALPGGTMGQRATMAVVPALASEAAGQATKGTPAEPYARAGAGIVAGLGTAGAQALGRQPVNRVLREASGPSLNRQAVESAATLIDDAAARGITLTWDEALNQATGGAVNLSAVRQGAQGNAQGGIALTGAMAQRPGQIDAAARQQFGQVAPQTNAPSSIGRAVGTAAEDSIDSVRQNINRVSEPYYTASETVLLSPPEMAKVRALPGYKEAADAVRSDPQLMRNIQGLPENSVGFLNQVKIQLDTMGKNAAGQFNQNRNLTVASGLGSDAAAVRQAAVDASPEYAQALAIQQAGREKVLQPLLDGPLGRLANKDQTTRDAINALFPKSPIAGTADEVGRATAALAQKNPLAARQLVRAHAETVFNETTRDLVAGANQFGGAKFAVAIKGNKQQAENLEASVKALPNGDQVWTGFNRFLEVLEATGKRPAVGSNTAEKLAMQKELQTGGFVGETANAISTGGLTIPRRLRDWYQQMQGGKNSAQLADILLDPKSVNIFRALASEKTGIPASVALATRLTYMGERAWSKPNGNPPAK